MCLDSFTEHEIDTSKLNYTLKQKQIELPKGFRMQNELKLNCV